MDRSNSCLNFRCIVRKRNLLAHISVWTIIALVLLISLTVFKGNLFGIIYLTFFLIFVLIFQGSYSIWARTVKSFCIILIIYSTSVSLLTYSFQYNSISSLFKSILSDNLLKDIGLVVRDKGWMVFLEPLVPLTVSLLLFLYLRLFNDDFERFAYLASENDTSLSTPLTEHPVGLSQTINDSTFIMLSTNVGDTSQPETSSHYDDQQYQQQSRRESLTTPINASRIDLKRGSGRVKIKKSIEAANECCWRLLETHFIKLVAFMIFRLPIIDICLMNLPFLIIVIVVLKYPSTAKCSCLMASWLISFIIIIRNFAKLSTLSAFDITETCTTPGPLSGNTYSFLEFIGLSHNEASLLTHVDHHLLVLLLITIYSFIRIHYERRYVKNYELSFGVIFTGIGSREADIGLFNTFKYFCNFGFYKFGIEIVCLTLIVAISNRLDAIAAIYGLFLIIISTSTSKRTLASIWPMLNIIVALLVPIQYVLRLGLPPALCEPYPWQTTLSSDLKYWLFLSDYSAPQDAKLLLFDFLVLLAFCRQAVVFKHMSLNYTTNLSYNSNAQAHRDLSAVQFRHKYLPNVDEFAAEDCFSNYTTQSNYMKSIFFISIYWITLAVVLTAGATKVSLFSLGYLIGCFIFLWLGNDAYLLPLPRLIFSWNLLIFYAALVIFIKVILQFYTCYLHDYLMTHCYILQLLRVVCYRKMHNAPTDVTVGMCSATLPYDELDILWDGLCLMFLLMQRVVFGSQYFRYLVQEVKAQQILASRGAELIMATQIEEAKAQDLYEKEVMRSIREKMEDLKSDNENISKAWQRLVALPHHHQVIRNADKHLFSSSLGDEPVSQCRTDNWKFKKAFIPDPIGDELERMSEINGISAVFTRWMKGQPLYGATGVNGTSSPTDSTPSPRDKEDTNNANEEDDDIVTVDRPISSQERVSSVPHLEEKGLDGALSSFDLLRDSETSGVAKVRGWWDMLTLIIYSCLLSATVELNKLSRSYRYVSRRMAVEKNTLKKQFNLNDERFKKDPAWRKWVISTLSDTYTKTSELYERGVQSNTSLHRIRSALKMITNNGAGSSQDSNQSTDNETNNKSPNGQSKNKAELSDPEYYFLKLNMFTQFCRALAYVFISNTSLLCQLVIIFNQVVTASLLSLPLPLLTFLWGTLSVPRPTKRFWKTVITYTELVIVVKYVCQFPLWDWEVNNIYTNLFGIKNITIIYDLMLLLALFFHRSMLKSLGQWGASDSDGSEEEKQGTSGPSTSFGSPTSVTEQPQDIITFDCATSQSVIIKSSSHINRGHESEFPESRLTRSVELDRTNIHSDYNSDGQGSSYHNQEVGKNQVDHVEVAIHDDTNGVTTASCSCCDCLSRSYHRTRRSIALFFNHVLHTPCKVQTDVYTWMFICDFINFLILIYGFWAFGGGYSNQTVASFLNENRIPFSVLIMLLAQFASIIIDRAFYLQKNIGGKLMFQVVLVIGIHLWLFFFIPFITGHALTLKEYWPPRAWYVFKCLYFLLSAHQIRSGYPRRVLGNCFTKGFGYVNWIAFKVYRAIPLVYDLRLYMDWIWTGTTLEFRNWSIMEDMFANLFIRKCELTLEEEYPQPRAKPIRRINKYLTGGAFILLILAIIWGPLLLFSMGKTVGESNPPTEMEFELEFVGFQPILRMRATAQQIVELNENQYNLLKTSYPSQSAQNFFSDYKVGDVAAIRLDGQSNAVWEISPPSKELLMNSIKFNETLILKSTWNLFRIKKQKSQNFDVSIAGTYQIVINGNSSQTFRQALYDMLANSSTTLTPAVDTKFVVTPPIFPNYIRVPETGQGSLATQLEDNPTESSLLRPLNLSYIRMYDYNINQISNAISWWKAEDSCKYHPANDSYPFWNDDILTHCDSLVVVTFNDRIFTGILALLSAPGIIGIYTTFVVFFARLIRTEPSGRVIYTEIPKVDRVYGLIMDIYMMRECGEFELEEKLFAKLLFLWRSPEMLIEWSKRDDAPPPAPPQPVELNSQQ